MTGFVPDFVLPQPGETDSLNRLFAAIGEATRNLNEEALFHLEQNEDAAAAALLLHSIREARKELALVEAAVEATAASRMQGKTIAVPGFLIERKGGTTNHKWDDEKVAWDVLVQLAKDGNGEIDDAAADLLGKARDDLLACCSISYWRINDLKAHGIEDPYVYRTSEKGRYTVVVTPAQDMDRP